MAIADIDKLSKDDKKLAEEALKTGDWSKVPTPALRLLADMPYSTGEVVEAGLSRAMTSTIRGVAQLFASDDEDSLVSISDEDLEMEKEFRSMLELNPVAGWSSYILGSAIDPLNLVGVGKVKGAADAFLKFGALGGAAGFVEPVYEEYDDSRLVNTAIGAGAVGAIGAGLTKLTQKIAGKTGQEVQEALVDQATSNLNAATVSAGKPVVKVKPVVRDVSSETVEDTSRVPAPQTSPFQQTVINTQQAGRIPQLSATDPVKFNNSVLNFESDIDRAAIAFSRGLPNKESYFDYIKNTLQVNDEQALNIIKDVDREITEKLNKRSVIEEGLKDTTAVKTSNTIDNLLNPAYKHLDDESRYVYNYSKLSQEAEGDIIPSNTEGFKQFDQKTKDIFPDLSLKERIEAAKGYQLLMDALKKHHGSRFTSSNIRNFANNRAGNTDAFVAALKHGDYDNNKNFYKYFLPTDNTPSFTASQIREIASMSSDDAAKLLGRMSEKGDARTIKILSGILGPERIRGVSRIGESMSENAKFAKEEAERIKSQLSPEQLDDGSRAADIIAQGYRKGDTLSPGEREILYTHYADEMPKFLATIDQLDYALEHGNDETLIYLFNKLLPGASIASAIAGDANAVSRIFNDFKRLNKIIAEAKDVTRIFENGAC